MQEQQVENNALNDKVVFVVDDEPRVLSAIADSVRALGSKVQSFASAEECLASLREKPCHLLISDVNMPGMDGIALLTEVRRVCPMLPVIVMSGVGDIPMAVRAVREGALDFIEKPLDEATFLPLVKTTLMNTSPLAKIDLSVLTPTEKKVLQLVAEGKSNKEIARLFDRSLRTVENHRHRIMVKLDAANVTDLVRLAIAAGLVSGR